MGYYYYYTFSQFSLYFSCYKRKLTKTNDLKLYNVYILVDPMLFLSTFFETKTLSDCDHAEN